MTASEVVRGALYRKGYNRNMASVCRITGLSRSALYRRISGEVELTRSELHRLDTALEFTDEECVQLIRSKTYL